MHIFLRSKRAQNTMEYAITIAVVVAAAMAMQIYVGRGLKGGIKHGMDHATYQRVGQDDPNQYEPYYLKSDYTTETPGYLAENLTILPTGQVYKAPQPMEVYRSGYQKINATE